MKVKKIVVDSDIIAEHLTASGGESVLRQLVKKYFCYTTVFTAIELFAAARSLKERQAVEDAMNALKLLGINGKSAKSIAPLVGSGRPLMAMLIAGVCVESRLPIATLHPKRFASVGKLDVIDCRTLIQQGGTIVPSGIHPRNTSTKVHR